MSIPQRTALAFTIGTVLGLALGVGQCVMAERQQAAEELPWEEARLLAEVMERVKQNYVEPVDERELYRNAVRGVLEGLDPHSSFLDEEDYEQIRISTTGNYTGIGIEVVVEDGLVTVVSPIDHSPAAQAGIRPGDVVLAVDGESLVDSDDLDAAIRLMRGLPGTDVALTLGRDGVDDPLEMSLTRARIHVASVRGETVAPGVGYLRVTQFDDSTASELRETVERLASENAGHLDGLVLDLRNNPGGVLEAAVDVADAFLDEGRIVSAEGRTRSARFHHSATPGDVLAGAPLVVLVNGGSASASEIVAGALQDHHRATVAGDVTFGKGSVQTIMPISDGMAIKLTTSRYFTPSGRSIHGSGLTPDVTLARTGDEEVQPGADDEQVREAIALVRGRSMAAAEEKAPR